MACKNPLTGVLLGINPDTGKKIIKVLPVEYKEQVSLDPNVEYIPIPCGHCIDCRLSKGKEWSARCMLETQYYNDCYFLTLTYDDEHLPSNDFIDNYYKLNNTFPPEHPPDDDRNLMMIYIDQYKEYLDEIVPKPDLKIPYIHPLKYDDVQRFIKRLRSHFDEKEKQYNENNNDIPFPDHSCRYYGCGEYGPNNLRPHYHIIFFGLPLDDLVVRKIDQSNGFIYYTSDLISKKWNNGFHLITKVDYNCCAYVAQYVLKKQYGYNSKIYDILHIPSEFSFMSRRPGIGRQYYEDHKKDIYRDDLLLIKAGEKSFHSRPPKYFDRLYDIDEHEEMEFIKKYRSSDIEMSLEQKKNNHSGSFRDILKDEEINQEARTKILKERSKFDETFIFRP